MSPAEKQGKKPYPEKAAKHADDKKAEKNGSGKKGFEKDKPGKDKGLKDKKDPRKDVKKGPGKDVRRAYEHLVRVTVVLGGASQNGVLTELAQRVHRLATGGLETVTEMPEYAKIAAELARAAEHIAFASVIAREPDEVDWTEELQSAFTREYEELAEESQLEVELDDDELDEDEEDEIDEDDEEAEDDDSPEADDDEDAGLEHDDEDDEGEDALEMIYTLVQEAEAARNDQHYARALECMRGAEALASAARHLDRLENEA